MDNLEDLFIENCILPCIGEAEPVLVRKDLNTLLKELNTIENNIEEIKAKEEHLSKMRALNMGLLPD